MRFNAIRTSFSTLLLSVFLFTSSCNKDNDSVTPSAYPKNVTIEYKVSSPTGVAKANVIFTNETGGLSNLDNQTLPFTKKVSRSVKLNDALTLRTDAPLAGKLKVEILVDNNVVKTETGEGTSVVLAQAIYIFQ